MAVMRDGARSWWVLACVSVLRFSFVLYVFGLLRFQNEIFSLLRSCCAQCRRLEGPDVLIFGEIKKRGGMDEISVQRPIPR